MKNTVERILSFFLENFPSWNALLLGGPLGLLWAYACLFLAGYLKRHRGFQTGYSRKVFHFLIFMSVAGVHSLWGLRLVLLFGGMTSFVIFYAIFRGSGHLLYEAMAREKDEPHRTYYIVAPYLATLAGGLLSNLLFGSSALFGYLAAGLGDAMGEPVGTRLGKHHYRVPSFKGVPCTRTYEGSAAVLLTCAVAGAAGILLCPPLEFTALALLTLPAFGVICTIVEALSPHGWDNATMQVIPSLLARMFF